jgi:hypothetical protein
LVQPWVRLGRVTWKAKAVERKERKRRVVEYMVI